MDGIVLGQYVPGNSFLHKLDPRTKMILAGVILWTVFLLKAPLEYFSFGLIILLMFKIGGVTDRLLRILRPGVFLVFFTLLINMVFTPGTVLFDLGIAVITREGLVQGLSMGFRLVFLIATSSLITLTTSPVRMTDGMEIMMKPLKKIGVPVSELIMMMNIALRFLPTFLEELDKIRKAQSSRGADFDSWHPVRRIKFITALLVPLFISAFRKADELSVAIESRGYVVGMKRSSLHKLEFNSRDYLTLVLMFSLIAAFWGYKYLL